MDTQTFRFIETNGISLHVAEAGPKEGKLVVLLHGFPEFWYGWRHQISDLANAGYRVIAPDQRGYHLSSKPQGIEAYTLDILRDDIAGLIAHYGWEQAIIVGHDWGGAVAWHLAATKPDLVEKLIAVNIPHPRTMGKVMARNPLQWLKSSYMAFFQLPTVPEELLAANHFAYMQTAMKGSGKGASFTEEDMKQYRKAWAQPGALTGMLNWYRALRKGSMQQTPRKLIEPPVRIIWGVGDPFLLKSLAVESLKFCGNGEGMFIGNATHWVQHEQPRIVNRLIKEFIE
ncbi:alpha/beta fold hydrolase [Planomicrobium sp. YIM 101495]|uniref:alpha/beta fold hydrolase n=1 Tax=Planomicrobium sp. YIM 101495 TaxID=2665160 RepID=UPI0012B6E875|nr:alpha/beta hydrolase [Planomicrobium sp. YIM 101495]MTD32128.1 alpha/beta fold hydrolase [Planomicrobium sp. YIM 101495]